MNPSIVDAHLHHQLIPHREQSATYGISSSASVHPQQHIPADKFPPPLIDPSTFWHNHSTLPPLSQDNAQMAITLPYPMLPVYPYATPDECVTPGAREKRHCCQLCNKRFDRPSTLKKHMLVHTGEKAWACAICGRRFSVSSNLNRHTRRCREKWAKSEGSVIETPPPSAISDPSESTDSPPSSSSSSSDGSDDGTRSHDQRHVAGKALKRRRKGSPPEPWVPASLVNFNLDPATRYFSTPLPAVVPDTCEERNSYADTPMEAYHPSCWTGNLVGPSYVPRGDEVSRGGRLLVF